MVPDIGVDVGRLFEILKVGHGDGFWDLFVFCKFKWPANDRRTSVMKSLEIVEDKRGALLLLLIILWSNLKIDICLAPNADISEPFGNDLQASNKTYRRN